VSVKCGNLKVGKLELLTSKLSNVILCAAIFDKTSKLLTLNVKTMPANQCKFSSEAIQLLRIDQKLIKLSSSLTFYIHTRPMFRFRILLFKIQNTISQYFIYLFFSMSPNHSIFIECNSKLFSNLTHLSKNLAFSFIIYIHLIYFVRMF